MAMGTFGRPPTGYRFQWRGLFTPAIKILLIANCSVFLVQRLVDLTAGEGASRWLLEHFGLIPVVTVLGLRVWQPVTYLFLHGDILHLLLNMLMLWMFGADLERAWGKQRFLSYYFMTGIGAGLCIVAVNWIPRLFGSAPRVSATIGASGAIYGILLAAAMVFPDRQVWLFPLPVMLPMRIFVLLFGLIAFFGSLGGSSDGISHLAHLGGLVVGYFYLRRGSYFFSLRNHLTDWKQRRLKRKFQVYIRDHRDEPPSRPDRWVH